VGGSIHPGRLRRSGDDQPLGSGRVPPALHRRRHGRSLPRACRRCRRSFRKDGRGFETLRPHRRPGGLGHLESGSSLDVHGGRAADLGTEHAIARVRPGPEAGGGARRHDLRALRAPGSMTAPERRATAPPSPAAPAPGEIDGLQAELARIREELGTRNARLSRLGRTVAELDERCAGLRQELAARQEELDRLAGENRRYATDLSGGRDEIARLSAEVEHLASEVRDLHASTSWRVTGPMRGLKNAVLRLRSGLRGTPSSEMPPSPPARAVENPDAVLVARSGLFDPDHYAAQAPGLREGG